MKGEGCEREEGDANEKGAHRVVVVGQCQMLNVTLLMLMGKQMQIINVS